MKQYHLEGSAFDLCRCVILYCETLSGFAILMTSFFKITIATEVDLS
jgi:hypothetical protein